MLLARAFGPVEMVASRVLASAPCARVVIHARWWLQAHCAFKHRSALQCAAPLNILMQNANFARPTPERTRRMQKSSMQDGCLSVGADSDVAAPQFYNDLLGVE